MKDRRCGTDGIRDAVVAEQTGKTWAEWFAVIEAWDRHMDQQADIARYLHKSYRMTPWWAHAVAIRYRHECGRLQDGE